MCAFVPTPHHASAHVAKVYQFALLTNRARNGSSLLAVWYAASALSPTSSTDTPSTHAAPLSLWWPQCALSSPPLTTTSAHVAEASTNLPCSLAALAMAIAYRQYGKSVQRRHESFYALFVSCQANASARLAKPTGSMEASHLF
jgi:hypothetical protein